MQILCDRIPGAPEGYLRQLIRKGKISLSDKPISPETVLHHGELIKVVDSQRLNDLMTASASPGIEILYETPYLLIAYKPAGLAVHKGVGHEQDNLTDRIRQWLKHRKAPYEAKPIHRLDLETSGPVLFGKGRKAASTLGKLFMANQAEKKYLALCAGEMATPTGVLRSSVPAKGKIKEAETAYRQLASQQGLSLVEMTLLSGRTHQIRRQLADAGHPLAGDRRYGGAPLTDLQRLFLHCHSLSLPDPFGGPFIRVRCPLPKDLQQVLCSRDIFWSPSEPEQDSGPANVHPVL